MAKTDQKSGNDTAAKVGGIAAFLTDAKTIAAFALAFVAAIFWLGAMWVTVNGELKGRIDQIDRHEASLQALEMSVQALENWSPGNVETGSPSGIVTSGTPANPPSVCPEGYYVTGLVAYGIPNADLSAVQVQCRQLNTK